MSFHTKRSPSQSHRFLECPGTFAMCDTLDEIHRNQAGIAAQMGTAAHALSERCLREGSNPEDYRGRIIEIIDDGASILRAGAKTPGRNRVFFEVDSDMIDGTELHTTYVRQRCKELGIAESDLELESRTNPLPDRDDTSGTADVTIKAFPAVLEVVDYKNGYNLVDHEDNDQLLAYLLGKALEEKFAYETYKVTVVQPNAPHVEGRVRSFPATRKELLAFQKRYRAGIEKCEEAEADAVASEAPAEQEAWSERWLKSGEHCLFCDAQAVCPARKKLAQQHAKLDFAEEPRELVLATDSTKTAEDVARILDWAPQMETLIKAASLYAQRSMESGHTIPGYKLVRGRSNRKWRDDIAEAILVAEIASEFKIARDRLFTKPEMLSGPQVEKLLPAKLRKKFSDNYLFKPEGALTVAAASDPREAITCSAGDDFAAIEDDTADELDFG